MMRHVWRSSLLTSCVLFVVGGALALLFASSMSSFKNANSYWLGITAQSGIALIASAAIASLGGAIEGARLRSAKLNKINAHRSFVAVAARSLAPTYVAALLIQGASFLSFVKYASGATDSPNVPVLFAFVSIISAHMLFGFNLGLRLPSAIAYPVALTASYAWLGAAWSVNYFALRYMAGLILIDCCRIDQELDQRAISTAILFNVGLVASLLLLARARLKLTRRLPVKTTTLAIAIATICAILANNVAAPLGPFATKPRDLSTMNCKDARGESHSFTEALAGKTNNAPEVCFFSSQDRHGLFDESLRATWQMLRKLNLDVAPIIVASNQIESKDEIGVVATPSSTPSVVSYSLVSDFVQQPIDCQTNDETWAARDLNYRYLMNFLLTASSSKSLDLSPFAPPLAEGESTHFAQLKSTALEFAKSEKIDPASVSWLHKSLAAISDCSIDVPAPL